MTADVFRPDFDANTNGIIVFLSDDGCKNHFLGSSTKKDLEADTIRKGSLPGNLELGS